jgi:hypothetical protein
MRRLPPTVAILSSSLLLLPMIGPTSRAQETLWKRVGVYDHFFTATQIARAGDLDGDGLPDLLVGFHYNGQDTGVVRALRGSDGSDLFVIDGQAAGDNFGWSVAGLGDVDGDLVCDFAASSRGSVTSYVAVHSGASGALLYTVTAKPAYTFGAALARIDDVDHDGLPDLLVGEYGESLGSGGSGAVHLYGGGNGAWIRSLFGDGGTDQTFGFSVAGVGDLDGDGVPDLAVGAPELRYLSSDTDGSVFVYSGATGALLREWSGLGEKVFFGQSVVDAGDVNGDGVSDLLVGAPGANRLFDDQNGAAYLYSGATLAPIVYRLGDQLASQFGATVASVGDVDGDGSADFAADVLSGTGHWGEIDLIRSDDLLFTSNIKFPRAADDLVLTTSAGDAGQLALLVVEEADGAPLFVPIVSKTLNARGEWHLLATVPAGLAGHSVALRSWSLDAGGRLVSSSLERLGFR